MNPYSQLNEILTLTGIPLFGWTLLQQPLTIGIYKDWIDQNKNASMGYLKTHFEKKENPQQLARSAIVVGIPYIPHPSPLEKEKDKISHLRKATYSQGHDYHYWLKEKLDQIIEKLNLIYPNDVFFSWTDSGPVLERDLAYRCGLGWIGKNTCLIQRNQGSFFLIGEIYTTLYLENQNPLSADFCGSCNRCMEACPTQAIESPRFLNPHKCISYWTIESKEIPPVELRTGFQDWIFGCDICQTVCPWNKDVLKQLHTKKVTKLAVYDDLKWILQSSNKELQKAFVRTPFARAAGNKLKRNALIVIGNLKLKELKFIVKNYTDPSCDLHELAKWCLNELE